MVFSLHQKLKTLSVKAMVFMFLFTLTYANIAYAEGPAPIKTAWLAEHEAFPAWYAKKLGWDKESGIEIEMLRFATGKALTDGIKAYQWVIGACGALPAIDTPLIDQFSIIAAGNDESAANVVLVRGDSPILEKKGVNAQFPNVYGDAQSVRKKTVFCPRGTSAHYTLVRWLYTLGLTEKDVQIRFLEPAQALGAFRGGAGDILVLWAPWYYKTDIANLKVAARGSDCEAFQPTVLLVNNELAASRDKDIRAFLACYLRAAEQISSSLSSKETIHRYMEFLKEWSGYDIDEASAIEDLAVHKLFSQADQLALFDMSRGESVLYRELKNIADMYGALTPSPEVQQMEVRVPQIRTTYLKDLQQK